MLKYFWSEDSEPETVISEDITVSEPVQCFHCDRLIEAGSPAVKLWDTSGEKYILHEHCAKQSLDGAGVVIDRCFSWDYERKADREDAVKKELQSRHVCVLTDHNWAHYRYSLESYAPLNRTSNFTGGIYEEVQAVECTAANEAEAYKILSKVLRQGYLVRFQYDGVYRSLTLFRFRPVLENKKNETTIP